MNFFYLHHQLFAEYFKSSLFGTIKDNRSFEKRSLLVFGSYRFQQNENLLSRSLIAINKCEPMKFFFA